MEEFVTRLVTEGVVDLFEVVEIDHHRRKTTIGEIGDVEIERTELKGDDILYIHDNYTVTDGIYRDENIIFDKVTDVWKQFCEQELSFEIPVIEPIEIPTEEASGDSAEG